jgi:hypothetical protein
MEETGRALAVAMGPTAPRDLEEAPDQGGAAERVALRARVSNANARMPAAHARSGVANRQALATLRAQRTRLATLLRDATRATAQAVASDSGLDLIWNERPADPSSTRQFGALLRQRWEKASLRKVELPL